MPANESTASGNSAVSGELMLKCSPCAGGVAAEPAALQEPARADRAGRHDDLARRPRSPAPRSRGVPARRLGGARSGDDPLDLDVGEHVEPVVAAAPTAARSRAWTAWRRMRSRCCSSRIRGRRLEMLADITSRRPGRSSASTASPKRLRRLRRRPLADLAGRRATRGRRRSRRAARPGRCRCAAPPLEHLGGRVEAERVVDRRAAADAHPLQDLEPEIGGELQRALVVEPQVLADLVVGERAAGRRAGRARSRARGGPSRRSDGRGCRRRRRSRRPPCRSARAASRSACAAAAAVASLGRGGRPSGRRSWYGRYSIDSHEAGSP